jgi:hypothetical protein
MWSAGVRMVTGMITYAMRLAGREMSKLLVDLSVSTSMPNLVVKPDLDGVANADLALDYISGKLESEEAIYMAMKRAEVTLDQA